MKNMLSCPNWFIKVKRRQKRVRRPSHNPKERKMKSWWKLCFNKTTKLSLKERNSDNDKWKTREKLNFSDTAAGQFVGQAMHLWNIFGGEKKIIPLYFFIFALDCSTLRPPHFTQPDFIADLKANIWNSKLGLVVCSKLWHFAESSHS